MVQRGRDRAIYIRIALDLRERIIAGEFPTGSKLPTEKILIQHYDNGKWAIGAAVDELRRWGYVAPSRPGQSARVVSDLGPREVTAKRGSRTTGGIATEEQASTDQARKAGVEAGMPIQVIDFYGQVEVYPFVGTTIVNN